MIQRVDAYDLPQVPPTKPTVVVYLSGGVVTGAEVSLDLTALGIEFQVIDFDDLEDEPESEWPTIPNNLKPIYPP